MIRSERGEVDLEFPAILVAIAIILLAIGWKNAQPDKADRRHKALIEACASEPDRVKCVNDLERSLGE